MSLTYEQHATLSRHYDDLRMLNLIEQNRRYREIVKEIPKIAELDAYIASEATRLCVESLTGNDTDTSQIHQIVQTIKEEKLALLSQYGYPKDYLEPIYHCQNCKDSGIQANGKVCDCFRRLTVDYFYSDQKRKEQANIENFSTFRTDLYNDTVVYPELGNITARENIERIFNRFKRYVENFDIEKKNALIYGVAGVGKTFLINCIYEQLTAKAYPVLFLTAYELFLELQKIQFNKDSDASKSNLRLDTLVDCDLLIIDDLGSELSNSFTLSQLFYIINERQLRKKATIISTNYSFDDLQPHYGERIFSRIVKDYEFYQIVGEDLRLRL